MRPTETADVETSTTRTVTAATRLRAYGLPIVLGLVGMLLAMVLYGWGGERYRDLKFLHEARVNNEAQIAAQAAVRAAAQAAAAAKAAEPGK